MISGNLQHLEGKILALNFQAHNAFGTSAVVLFQVRRKPSERILQGLLERIWDPCDYAERIDFRTHKFDRSVNELARDFLFYKGIREVFTLGEGVDISHKLYKSFLGFNLRFGNEWSHSPLTDTYWKDFFGWSGIALRYYDPRKGIFVSYNRINQDQKAS
jgi:hypothetical protein